LETGAGSHHPPRQELPTDITDRAACVDCDPPVVARVFHPTGL